MLLFRVSFRAAAGEHHWWLRWVINYKWNIKDEKIYLSWAIFQNFIFEENVKEILSRNRIWNPSWNLNVKVLLGSSLWENLFELVGEVLILGFEIVNYSVFILDVTLEFFDLMLETADLVIMDTFQFLDFSLSTNGFLPSVGRFR